MNEQMNNARKKKALIANGFPHGAGTHEKRAAPENRLKCASLHLATCKVKLISINSLK